MTEVKISQSKPQNCSILVKNIAPSVTPTPTLKLVIDFFVFCGDIFSLSLFKDTEDTFAAFITFTSETNAKTALGFDKTLINGREVRVEKAPDEFTVPPEAITEGFHTREDFSELIPPIVTVQNDKKTFINTLVDTVTTQAKVIDEQLQITPKVNVGVTAVTSTLNTIDEQLQISQTVTSTLNTIDDQLQISQTVKTIGTGINTAVQGVDNKAHEVGATVTGLFNTASTNAVTGIETAKTTIDQIVNPAVQPVVDGVKFVSQSLINTFETLFLPKQ